MQNLKKIKTTIKNYFLNLFKTNNWPTHVFENKNLTFDPPTKENFGHLSTNLALLSFKDIKQISSEIKSPFQFSQLLIKDCQFDFCEKVESVQPGFINFTFNQNFLKNQVVQLIKVINNENYFQQNSQKNQNILFEFTDPNPFKIFHTGHLMTNTIGEALIKIMENQGAKVTRLSYQGDIGLHIAKAIYSWQEKNKKKPNLNQDLEKLSLTDKNQFLGKCYVDGSKVYKENEKAKEKINQINLDIYHHKKGEFLDLYKLGKKWSLDYFEEIYKIINTHFDHYFFESEIGANGAQIVKKHLGDIFEESQSAIIFKGSKYKLHDRVFVNKLGLPTYEAKEIGLFEAKLKEFPEFNQSFVLTGNEVDDYFKVVFKAISFLHPDAIKKTKHLSHGLMKFAHSKMSSRTGNVIPAAKFLSDLTNKVSQSAKGKIDKKTAEKIAVSAVKYSLLKQSLNKNVIFDEKKDLSFEGNTGPYLLYTYVRANRVIKKSQLNYSDLNNEKSSKNLLTKEEILLITKFSEFSQVLAQIGKNLTPHVLCEYLFNLAQSFNLFYNNNQILNSENDEKMFRLKLTYITKQILKEGLKILGIETVDRM